MLRRGAAFLLVAAVAGLTGCAAGPSTAPPEGLSVSVYQNRVDVGNRKLSVSFQNETGGLLTITRLTFASPQFDGPADWPKESSRIQDGTTISLAVPLPPPDCAAQDPVPSVEFDYALEDGRSGTAVVEPVDTLERLPQLFVEDCVGVAVAEIVDIQVATAPRDAERGGRLIAEVDLTLTPTGSGGSVEFATANGTTLLIPVDAAGAATPIWPLGLTVSGDDAPSVVTIGYAPNRCDAHAIAEDKRGTILPFSVTIPGGLSGVLYLPAAEDVKSALYDYARRACGFTD
jgi:hypothetical protein